MRIVAPRADVESVVIIKALSGERYGLAVGVVGSVTAGVAIAA